MSRTMALLGVLALAGLAGCESIGTAAQSQRNQGALLGGVLGAGTGAIIGNQTGHAGAGTAIGGALGALGGGLMGNAMEENARAAQQQQFPPATTAPVAAGQAKFCPVGGETYPVDTRFCPVHGTELKEKL